MDKNQVLFDKIIDLAKRTENVRVVEMNGSRVNPNITKDQYQDFDIVFYVKNFKAFLKDETWKNDFDKPLVSQCSKEQRDYDESSNSYIYMLQFFDGTRLDLNIVDIKNIDKAIKKDSLSKIILDKDNYGFNSNPNESSYYVEKINEKDFSFTVNEFFWVLPYVAKGLSRNEVIYAYKHLNIIREELDNILDWWIGYNHDYKISVGKMKKKYKELLPKEIYEKYLNTYASIKINSIKSGLFQTLELFDCFSRKLADIYGYFYNRTLYEKMLDFLSENYNLTK